MLIDRAALSKSLPPSTSKATDAKVAFDDFEEHDPDLILDKEVKLE